MSTPADENLFNVRESQLLSVSEAKRFPSVSVSLPDAGVHISIRISRLYLRVYVLCTFRLTDLRPLVWNVAVCTCVLFE